MIGTSIGASSTIHMPDIDWSCSRNVAYVSTASQTIDIKPAHGVVPSSSGPVILVATVAGGGEGYVVVERSLPRGVRSYAATVLGRTIPQDMLEATTSASIAGVGLEPEVGPTVPSMLADIRAAFSLNVTQLALVLQVERPTIYAWLAGEQIPLIENRRRVAAVWELASVWMRLTNRPLGDRLRLRVYGDEDLLSLLQAAPLRAVAIERALRELAKEPSKLPTEPGGKGRELDARLGRSGPSPSARERVSVITGRRLGPEEDPSQ